MDYGETWSYIFFVLRALVPNRQIYVSLLDPSSIFHFPNPTYNPKTHFDSSNSIAGTSSIPKFHYWKLGHWPASFPNLFNVQFSAGIRPIQFRFAGQFQAEEETCTHPEHKKKLKN